MSDEPATAAAPALVDVVREIEAHASAAGWDHPAQLFALVDTADLLRREPALGEALGIPAEATGLTPIEQEALAPGEEVERVLSRIAWPAEVAGCAAVLERLVLPPEAEQDIPADAAAAASYAADHPDRQDVRIVAAVTRAGESFCAIRLRSHDSDDAVVGAPDLVPELLELIGATLHDESETSDEFGSQDTDGTPA